MSPGWLTATVSALVACIAILAYAIRVGLVVGRVDAMERLVGLGNGSKSVFLRADLAEKDFATLNEKVDRAQASVDEVAKQLTDIKLILAGRKEE